MKIRPKTIFITGASSGIGRALAIRYAGSGQTLFLCGRNQKRLEQVANICRQKQANVHTFQFDVRDPVASAEAITKADLICSIDLIIANAGVSAGVLGMDETPVSGRTIFETNIFGVINTILPMIEKMKSRRQGQIAILSSLSGYRGMSSCPSYSASKACVKAWGEALWGSLRPYGIRVTTICPGFIETPLTDKNKFKMPFLMPVDKAADIIVHRLEKCPPLIAFPWIMALGAWLGSVLPARIILPILGKLPQKETTKEKCSQNEKTF
ncbi:MAG: SDR family NAD(P)-dependent oxidoreductase [Pseudomonadota bacterium]|nr:SDR family NAD(P)-dependent oxidoreductase [Pseudomonadota bacterium]